MRVPVWVDSQTGTARYIIIEGKLVSLSLAWFESLGRWGHGAYDLESRKDLIRKTGEMQTVPEGYFDEPAAKALFPVLGGYHLYILGKK